MKCLFFVLRMVLFEEKYFKSETYGIFSVSLMQMFALVTYTGHEWKRTTRTNESWAGVLSFSLLAVWNAPRGCWSHVTFGPSPLQWRSSGRDTWAHLRERGSGESVGLNMTLARSCWRSRTLSGVLFQTFRSRRGSLASGPVRTDTAPRRCLSIPPSPGAWTSELSQFSPRDLYRLSVTEPDRFWGAAATDRLRWMEPFHRVQDCELRSGKINWFLGGKLNVSGEKLLRK